MLAGNIVYRSIIMLGKYKYNKYCFSTLLMLFATLYAKAQSYYMHEAAEESGGFLFNGALRILDVVETVVVVIVVLLFIPVFFSEKKDAVKRKKEEKALEKKINQYFVDNSGDELIQKYSSNANLKYWLMKGYRDGYLYGSKKKELVRKPGPVVTHEWEEVSLEDYARSHVSELMTHLDGIDIEEAREAFVAGIRRGGNRKMVEDLLEKKGS